MHITTLRRAELELAAGDARAARASAEQALRWLRERGEHFFEADALRTRGDAERALGDMASAEASYFAAIDVARAQQAKLFELRATNSLVRLWKAAGRVEDGRTVLQPLVDQLSREVDCLDVREASELLAHLHA